MKVIIAGTRSITDYNLIKKAVSNCGWELTAIVSGKAFGVDELGERYAKENKITLYEFPAEWDNLEAPKAVIKINKWGKPYNAKAGHDRNAKMAEVADALIAIWDGKSKGTRDMIHIMKYLKKDVYVMEV
jgi:hypothetical protein